MEELKQLSSDPRVTVRRTGPEKSTGKCVVYWMQRSQRALDNPALDVAIEVANALRKPVVAFLAPMPFYPRANLRHYTFLIQGLADIADGLRRRHVGFVLRRYPQHKLLDLCDEASVAHWEGEMATDWSAIHARLSRELRLSKIRHPTKAHQEKRIAPMRRWAPERVVKPQNPRA